MGDENYDKILERIAKASGLEKAEIERRVEAKRAKLSGLISLDGAAQVVAAELGISFDNEKLNLNELLTGMKRVNVVGKVISLFPVRSFSKNGKEGKVANLVIADETSNVKVVLWDIHHIELVETGKISEGSVVEIFNSSVRDNEVHLGSFSEIKLSSKVMDSVNTNKASAKDKSILEAGNFGPAKFRAFVVQAFEPRFFEVCPQCKKKPAEPGKCVEHGDISPERRALINLVIDDGTETIRAVLFHDSLRLVGLTELDNLPALTEQKQQLLGKELFFSGEIRQNKIFNNKEFVVNSVEQIDHDALISMLEK